MPSEHRELEAGAEGRRRRRLHPLVVVSLILGLLSLRPLAAAGAVVTGLWARRSIRRNQDRQWGRTLSLAGVALGCIGLATTAISALRMVALYREVTPLAERLLTMVDEEQWVQTYDLFSSRHRQLYPPDRHAAYVQRVFAGSDHFRGVRWAFRFSPRKRLIGGDQVHITYDARFGTGKRRYTFQFVRTTIGWRIDRIGSA